MSTYQNEREERLDDSNERVERIDNGDERVERIDNDERVERIEESGETRRQIRNSRGLTTSKYPSNHTKRFYGTRRRLWRSVEVVMVRDDDG